MLDDIAVVARGVIPQHQVTTFVRSLPSQVQLIVVDTSPFANMYPVALRPERTTVLHYRGSAAKALQVGAMMARRAWLLFADMNTYFCSQYFDLVQDYHENDIIYGPVLSWTDSEHAQFQRTWRAPWQRFTEPRVQDANLLVRSTAFFKVGGFSRDLVEGQGADFVKRANAFGVPATFRSDLVVYRSHYGEGAQPVRADEVSVVSARAELGDVAA
jgi:hypothetical protein